MKIVNDKALDFARGPGVCDWCLKLVRSRDPHHVFSRGAGQVDIPANIAAICTTFAGGLNCHHLVHSGEIDDSDILARVAIREDALQGDIEALVWLIRRMPRISEMSVERYESIVWQELNFGGRRLAMKQIESFAHLLGR